MLLRPAALITNILLISSSWASEPQNMRRAQAKSLSDSVPSCALPCLKSFISSNYPSSVCADPKDVECLCTRESIAGLTLGEAALRCEYTSCLPRDESDFLSYHICSGVEGSRPNTRTHISATATVTATHTVSSRHTPGQASLTTSTTTNGIRSQITSIANNSIYSSNSTNFLSSSQRTSTSTIHSDVVTSTSTQSKLEFSTQTAISPSDASGVKLSQGQQIGIYVGAGAAFVFIVATFLFCCLNNRRKEARRQNKDRDFEIGGTMKSPAPNRSLFNRPRVSPEIRTPTGAYNTLSMAKVVPMPTIRQQPSGTDVENRGSDCSLSSDLQPDSERSKSPVPQRRNSRLLPENPYRRGDDGSHGGPEIFRIRPNSSVTVFDDYPDSRKNSINMINCQGGGVFDRTEEPRGGALQLNPQVCWTPNPQSARYSLYSPTHVPSPRHSTQSQVSCNNPYWTIPDGYSWDHPTNFQRTSSGAAYPAVRPPSNAYSQFLSGSPSKPNFPSGAGRDSGPRRSSLRHSGASSTTSFETTASNDPDNGIIPGQTQRRLSPVEEVASAPGHSESFKSPMKTPYKSPLTIHDDHNPFHSLPLTRNYSRPPSRSRSYRRSRVRFETSPNLSSTNHPISPPTTLSSRFSNRVSMRKPSPPSLNAEYGRRGGPYYPLTPNNNLLVKRRGEIIADKMENQFSVPPNDNITHSRFQSTPATNYMRTSSSVRKSNLSYHNSYYRMYQPSSSSPQQAGLLPPPLRYGNSR